MNANLFWARKLSHFESHPLSHWSWLQSHFPWYISMFNRNMNYWQEICNQPCSTAIKVWVTMATPRSKLSSQYILDNPRYCSEITNAEVISSPDFFIRIRYVYEFISCLQFRTSDRYSVGGSELSPQFELNYVSCRLVVIEHKGWGCLLYQSTSWKRKGRDWSNVFKENIESVKIPPKFSKVGEA